MTKIKGNIRGDSGLTDSQLMRSQTIIFKKNQEALDEMERSSKLEMDRRRFQTSAKPPKRGLWQKIVNFLRF